MRLAHFSDLHLLSLQGAKPSDFLNKRSLGGVNLLLNRGRHYRAEVFRALIEDVNGRGADEVVCTGDLTNLALASEFSYARSFLERLILSPAHVTCIPGNHDVYVADASGRFEDCMAAYARSDPEWTWPDGVAWPSVRVRDQVAIIGLSSSQPRGWLHSYGELGADQLARLELVLGDPRLRGRCRVVLIHHPCAGPRAARKDRGLIDQPAFAAVLARTGAELVLHGHEHELVEESLHGPGLEEAIPVRCITSGSYAGHRRERMARWRTYLIENARLVGFEDRVYQPQKRRFVFAA
jgi:3',5'-cyclic AMP phosphodiesterase CpdA